MFFGKKLVPGDHCVGFVLSIEWIHVLFTVWMCRMQCWGAGKVWMKIWKWKYKRYFSFYFIIELYETILSDTLFSFCLVFHSSSGGRKCTAIRFNAMCNTSMWYLTFVITRWLFSHASKTKLLFLLAFWRFVCLLFSYFSPLHLVFLVSEFYLSTLLLSVLSIILLSLLLAFDALKSCIEQDPKRITTNW